jgi:hypothetical protein
MIAAPTSSALQSSTPRELVTIHVPLAFRRRGGRRVTLAATTRPITERSGCPADTPAVLALAKAFRWRRLLESGDYVTIKELAAAEGVNESYLSRVLRLTLLAPDTVEALLTDRAEFPGLGRLLAPFPAVWSEQRTILLR